jgi:hypothetical protein
VASRPAIAIMILFSHSAVEVIGHEDNLCIFDRMLTTLVGDR